MLFRSRWRLVLRLVVPCCAILCLAATHGFSQTFTRLHSFAGPDGSYPLGGVVSDASGVLYGTTESGGTGFGTVYSLTPQPSNGTFQESLIYSFSGEEGQGPSGSLLLSSGVLYGTASAGGKYGAGTVFELTRGAIGDPWTFTLIYDFQAQADGNGPFARLTAGPGGLLYGTTTYGGNASCNTGQGCGTVFQLTPPALPGNTWTETVLYRFQFGTDGNNPAAGVVLGPDGSLYGTTAVGGSFNAGTVFQLTPPAIQGGLWTESIIYNFLSGSDGEQPLAAVSLSKSGTLFGTTQGGGNSGCGTVFELTPAPAVGQPWNKYTIHHFRCFDGAYPEAAVLLTQGLIYGTTASGGNSGSGTIFSLRAPQVAGTGWAESTLYNFQPTLDGANPVSNLILNPNGNLIGTAMSGGRNGLGTVFRLTP